MTKEIIYEIVKHVGQTLQLAIRTVVFDHSKTVEFEYIKRKNVALIIPLNANKDIVLLEQYRVAVDDFVLEFPGGKRNDDESIYDTAKRELEEETGFEANCFELIGTFYTAPHFTDEKIFVFLAQVERQKQQKLENEEILKLKIMTFEEVFVLYRNGNITDAKTRIAVSMLAKKFNLHA